MEKTTRAVRLNRLLELMRGRRAGYTPAELARATGVHVRTIQRDLLVLQTDMQAPLNDDHGRYSLMQERRLEPLALTLQQARAVYVATRLFLRFSDEHDPDAVGALQQLARVMPEPVREQLVAAAGAIERREFDAHYVRNLVTVTQAWARRRVLRLSYRSAGRARPREVLMHPYVLEPSAAGFATYVIGYSETHEAIRTFRVERIVSADMLPRAFDPPAGLDFEQLLSSAWGIIWGEGIEVQLRFAPDVTWRVKESRWHPSQQLEDTADGGCVLTLTVASMMELGRWVRSWGDRVEVLAPPALREELRLEAVRLARLYAAPLRPAKRARPARGKRARRPSAQAELPAG